MFVMLSLDSLCLGGLRGILVTHLAKLCVKCPKAEMTAE